MSSSKKPPSEVKGIEVGIYAETGLGQIVVTVDGELTKFFTPLQALELAWALIQSVRLTVRPKKRRIADSIIEDLKKLTGQ